MLRANQINRYFGVIVVIIAASVANGKTAFVETFENGSNVGNWTYGSSNGFIDPTGGNPGAFFHDPWLFDFFPQPHTNQDSVFTRNYQSRQVTQVGIDLITFYVEYSAGGRPLSVMLQCDSGTPGYVWDDWAAYTVGLWNIPLVGEGWISYEFDIPSQATSWPVGWGFIQFGPESPENPDWNDVITDVHRLYFYYGDPSMVAILQGWDVGFDNVWITFERKPGDFEPDGDVDFYDFAVLALAWFSNPGDDNWNPACDISEPKDNVIDFCDLAVFVENWLSGC